VSLALLLRSSECGLRFFYMLCFFCSFVLVAHHADSQCDVSCGGLLIFSFFFFLVFSPLDKALRGGVGCGRRWMGGFRVKNARVTSSIF
jgi:hypothetical protein